MIDVFVCEWVGGWMDGRVDGWMDGWKLYTKFLCVHIRDYGMFGWMN